MKPASKSSQGGKRKRLLCASAPFQAMKQTTLLGLWDGGNKKKTLPHNAPSSLPSPAGCSEASTCDQMKLPPATKLVIKQTTLERLWGAPNNNKENVPTSSPSSIPNLSRPTKVTSKTGTTYSCYTCACGCAGNVNSSGMFTSNCSKRTGYPCDPKGVMKAQNAKRNPLRSKETIAQYNAKNNAKTDVILFVVHTVDLLSAIQTIHKLHTSLL